MTTTIVRHTPGPWRIEDPMPASLSIMAPDRPGYVNEYRIVASVDTDVETGIYLQEAQANARLIAAAPELLAEAKKFLQWINGAIGNDSMDDLAYRLLGLQVAIARAEGRHRP